MLRLLASRHLQATAKYNMNSATMLRSAAAVAASWRDPGPRREVCLRRYLTNEPPQRHLPVAVDNLGYHKRKAEDRDPSTDLPSSPAAPACGRGERTSGVRDAVLSTVFSVFVLFSGGILYMTWYTEKVLWKIERAFASGHDSVLELSKSTHPYIEEDGLVWDLNEPWLQRAEQGFIDRIVVGEEVGQYFILLGPKGTGKTTMVLDAMRAIKAEGVAMCDAHPDLEVFRLRLGKALNYEYNEDTQTGLFQRRDPREAGPSLDIERAMNKLEKVALRHARATKKPLILVLNNVHYFTHDDSGRNMLLQLQQRAEAWAASGILTMVFSSDDFWPFFVMRNNASRMNVVSVYDLSKQESINAARQMSCNVRRRGEEPEAFEEAVRLVGGRLTYLRRVAKSADMVDHAKQLLAVEKAWLLSQIGLIPDCDDEVIGEQRWALCSWLLLREFVKRRNEDKAKLIAQGQAKPEDLNNLLLPQISYYEARQIMTRADFLDELDTKNIIAIDKTFTVSPDSMLILNAAEQVCAEEGFDELLDGVRDRIDAIESLRRKRELTFNCIDKEDRIRLTVDNDGVRLGDK